MCVGRHLRSKRTKFESIFQHVACGKWVHPRCLGDEAGPDDTKFYRGHPILLDTCRLWHLGCLCGRIVVPSLLEFGVVFRKHHVHYLVIAEFLADNIFFAGPAFFLSPRRGSSCFRIFSWYVFRAWNFGWEPAGVSHPRSYPAPSICSALPPRLPPLSPLHSFPPISFTGRLQSRRGRA